MLSSAAGLELMLLGFCIVSVLPEGACDSSWSGDEPIPLLTALLWLLLREAPDGLRSWSWREAAGASAALQSTTEPIAAARGGAGAPADETECLSSTVGLGD